MITKFRVQNYKALRDVTLQLSPLHVLIGPNDSGKSSLLDAIYALCKSADAEPAEAFGRRWEGRQLVWRGEDAPVSISALIQGGFRYEVSFRFAEAGRVVGTEKEAIYFGDDLQNESQPGGLTRVYHVWKTEHKKPLPQIDAPTQKVHDALSSVQMLRIEPSVLSLPVALETADLPFRTASSGFGLARLLDDILSLGDTRYPDLVNQFKSLFPEIRWIQLPKKPGYLREPGNESDNQKLGIGKEIQFELVSGGDPISAAQVSEGVLIVLLYLALLYVPRPPRILLIEEPENGIHPQRLKELIELLRKIVDQHPGMQIILTTHSPYLLDLFQPTEVSLCRREKDGSVGVHCLAESALVRKQLDVFTLGEIWTAEGEDALIGTAEAVQ